MTAGPAAGGAAGGDGTPGEDAKPAGGGRRRAGDMVPAGGRVSAGDRVTVGDRMTEGNTGARGSTVTDVNTDQAGRGTGEMPARNENLGTGGNIAARESAGVAGTVGDSGKTGAEGTRVTHGEVATAEQGVPSDADADTGVVRGTGVASGTGLSGPPGSAGRHVVVIGGGLAGITAAIRLRESGAAVTVLEARPWLGGATCSFSRGEKVIDNGQHVFLRCCTEYQALLARLGMTGSVSMQERFDVTVLTPGGQARLRRNSLPAPLHMSGALARYGLLTPGERLKVGRAALGMRFANPASPRLDEQRLGDWLGARWQGERARRRLWDLFIISALNIAGDDASTGLAATVIKTALLGRKDAADIGMSAIPLGDLHGKSALRLLTRLGVDVRLASKAAAIEPGGTGSGTAGSGPAGPGAGRFRVPVMSGAGADEALSADAVVLAVPAAAAARLAPDRLAASAAQWGELGVSPIVNVHVHYDRRVTRLPFAAALESPVQWVFDKTRAAGVTSGQYLAVSQSAADDYVDVPSARIREEFLPALEQLFPAAADAKVLDFFVTRERRATFRQGPGTGRLRPGAGTVVPGLALAGAWTETGWPDTMEGAVRSGQNAAEHIISGLAALGPSQHVRDQRIKSGVIAAGASS
jgi:squalene-associated FAD-dependent desaturase